MSIWGPGPFDNDDGADWLAELEEAPELGLVKEALSEVAEPARVGYLEVTDCCEAVAAAEVLAEALGMPGGDPVLEETDVEAIKADLDRSSAREKKQLVQQALNAVEIVLHDDENSELRQLFEEDPSKMEAWVATMKNLERRLQAIMVAR